MKVIHTVKNILTPNPQPQSTADVSLVLPLQSDEICKPLRQTFSSLKSQNCDANFTILPSAKLATNTDLHISPL